MIRILFVCLLGLFSIFQAKAEESEGFSNAIGLDIIGATRGGLGVKFIHSSSSTSKITVLGYGTSENFFFNSTYSYQRALTSYQKLSFYALGGIGYIYAEGKDAYWAEKGIFGRDDESLKGTIESSIKPHLGAGVDVQVGENVTIGVEVLPFVATLSVHGGFEFISIYPSVTLTGYFYF